MTRLVQNHSPARVASLVMWGVLGLQLQPAWCQVEAGRSALYALQNAFASVADQVEPSVVTVIATRMVRPRNTDAAPKPEDDDTPRLPFGHPSLPRAYRSEGTGSGVILTSDGWVLTNDHVVGDADKVTVRLHDGREYVGSVRRDYRSDLALIKINATGLKPARLGDSDKVRIGHWAIAIGSPYRYEGSFSVGVISSLYRRQEIRSLRGLRLYPDMIQTDAAINPGNSGGPLVNIEGEVIGINTAIESDTGGSVGIGFAIPINDAKFVIAQLMAKGRVAYGYLGIEPDTVTPRYAAAYRVTGGARVQADPEPGSPAAKAGLQVDDVITQIGDKPIHNETDLRTTVAHLVPGTVVDVTFVRDGVTRRTKVTIGEWKDPYAEPPIPVPAPGRADLGITVAPLTPESARRAGVDEKTPGVVIRALDPASAASMSELMTGDVILRVNNVETPTVEAFRKAAAGLHSGDVVRILWVRKMGDQATRRVATIIVD
ncbi:MAG: trypsin-like peptidase domain-containing protein [Chthonomonadales bacterium]